MKNTIKLTDAEIAAEIESLRRKAHPMLVTGVVLLVICVTAAMILAMLRDSGSFDSVPGSALFILVGIGVIGGILAFIGIDYKRKLKRVVSDRLVRGVLEEFFEIDTFDTLGRIPTDVINSANMIDGWDSVGGSDYVRGTYKTVGIEFSDIELSHTKHESGQNGKTRSKKVTLFKGPWMICDLHRELPARLHLLERYQIGDDVETESIIFNERYVIRTDDQHIALYILTPHFMERIQEINDRARGKLSICFEGSRVHIAIDNRHDSFEISSKAAEFKDLGALRDRFRSEISYLTDIIDELMQNEKLYDWESVSK